MATSDQRSKEILSAAKKAISTIADPALRARATAKLETSQKKITTANRQATPNRQQRVRDRDLDFDR